MRCSRSACSCSRPSTIEPLRVVELAAVAPERAAFPQRAPSKGACGNHPLLRPRRAVLVVARTEHRLARVSRRCRAMTFDSVSLGLRVTGVGTGSSAGGQPAGGLVTVTMRRWHAWRRLPWQAPRGHDAAHMWAGRNRSLVVMLGTDERTRGGISAVVGVLRRQGLFERWQARYIATHCDGSAWRKLADRCPCLARGRWACCVRGRVALMHIHTASGPSFWRKSMFVAAGARRTRAVRAACARRRFRRFYESAAGRWRGAGCEARLVVPAPWSYCRKNGATPSSASRRAAAASSSRTQSRFPTGQRR